MSENILFLLIFGGVGSALNLVALLVWARLRRFVAESLRAEGTVIRLVSDSRGSRSYAPVVRFTPRGGGGAVEFKDPLYTSPVGYRVGQQVEVLYHWQDHARARLASRFRLYFVPGLLGLLGSIFTLVGAGLFLFIPE